MVTFLSFCLSSLVGVCVSVIVEFIDVCMLTVAVFMLVYVPFVLLEWRFLACVLLLGFMCGLEMCLFCVLWMCLQT